MTETYDPLTMIHNANLAPATREKYAAALERYLGTGHNIWNIAQLCDYVTTLPAATQAHLSAAVRLWTNRMMLYVKSQGGNQETIAHLEAIRDAVVVHRVKGQKAHTWLTAEQVEQLFAAVPDTLAGERDRVALGVLVGAGLRREEAVTLTFGDVLTQPTPGGLRAVLGIRGKGDKLRSVPVSDDLRQLLSAWGKRLEYRGRVLRRLEGDGLGDDLTGAGLFDIVKHYGAAIGMPRLAPHDLRRTYAQIGYTNGVPITQLSILLGHADIQTTMTYLNIKLDLDSTASDYVPIG